MRFPNALGEKGLVSWSSSRHCLQLGLLLQGDFRRPTACEREDNNGALMSFLADSTAARVLCVTRVGHSTRHDTVQCSCMPSTS